MTSDNIVSVHTSVFGVGVAALVFIIVGCAGERAPEGGPVDTTRQRSSGLSTTEYNGVFFFPYFIGV